MDLLITNARYAVTSNGSDEILENISIGIKDGKIAYLGTDKPAATKSYDASGKLIAPSAAHTRSRKPCRFTPSAQPRSSDIPK